MTSIPSLIIGATSGVGRALTFQLAQSGLPVVAIGRDATKLEQLAREASGFEGRVSTSTADVLDHDSIKAAIDAAAAQHGALAGLAYCPGSIDLKPLARVDAAAMQAAFALNCVSAALAVQAAAPALKAGHGSVVLFSTVAVAQGFANHAIVSAAKGAVEGLMRALAAELAPDVRVNCVAPSLTRTPLAAKLTSNPTIADGIAKLHAIPRLGEAADIAAAAAFLLNAASSWITGQVLPVDGGRSTLRTKG